MNSESDYSADWEPRTRLGRRLKELREQFVTEGGALLTPEEIDAEVRSRRGGTSSEDEEND